MNSPSVQHLPRIQVGELVKGSDEVEEHSKVHKMKPHVPGIVTFADHNKLLPWKVTYDAVVMFLDVSGFTSLCERYSTMKEGGIDQLTTTLNTYLSLLVEGILQSDGDILKFAGDAILAIWRVGMVERLPAELTKVLLCCLDIQEKCDSWTTSIGVKLSVKIGISAGEMSVIFLGNDEYRHYVEMGPAVQDVNCAENFCKSGYIVLSPGAWNLCEQKKFVTKIMNDGRHRQLLADHDTTKHIRSVSLPSDFQRQNSHTRDKITELARIDSEGSEIKLQHLQKETSPFKIAPKQSALSTVDYSESRRPSLGLEHGKEEPRRTSLFADIFFSRRTSVSSEDDAGEKRRPSISTDYTEERRRSSGGYLSTTIKELGKIQTSQTSLLAPTIVVQVPEDGKQPFKVDVSELEDEKGGSLSPDIASNASFINCVQRMKSLGRMRSIERARSAGSITSLDRMESLGRTLSPEKARSSLSVEIEDTQSEKQTKHTKPTSEKKIKLGSKFNKLRKLVETVTEMRLDLSLRLYILRPVLRKMDDNQPLEYLSEMRQVSIVFMNLILDPNKETTKLLQEIFQIVYYESKCMHGCLNKVFLFDKGCTFLLVFGLPGYKHENDCAHALICSQKMKRNLDELNGVRRVSIGVTTGNTFCGVVGHPRRHEYSVIGRRVNMAARLMIHYPEKISCDDNTFTTCRLSSSLFEILVTKAMKGLQNVGVIREYIGQNERLMRIVRNICHSDYPLLGRQDEVMLFIEQLELLRAGAASRKHLIYSAASGLGKTRLLDRLLTIAKKENFFVISCGVNLEDHSIHNLVSGHILGAIITKAELSKSVHADPRVMKSLPPTLLPYMYLLNDILENNAKKPAYIKNETLNECEKRKELLQALLEYCLMEETVVVVDDAQHLDNFSWEFLGELCKMQKALIILSLRPKATEKPSCDEAALFFKLPEVRQMELNGIDPSFMAPLACQMLDVVCIPKTLDRILRDRSYGVPSWCQELLRTMVDRKQLMVILDNGKPGLRQSCVTPKDLLVKPAISNNLNFICPKTFSNLSIPPVLLEVDSQDQEDESLLSSLGASESKKNISCISLPRDSSISLVEAATSQSAVLEKEKLSPVPVTVNRSTENLKKVVSLSLVKKETPDRIAMFAKGIIPGDIPVGETITELIVARLDSMRTSDQLLIKCAAVLGMTVHRDILETLVPKTHRPKLGRTIRKLMENGIFICGNTPTLKARSHMTKEEHHLKYRCFCSIDESNNQYGDVCAAPCFVNMLLQQTAYNVLLENQRIELHTKAAYSFEAYAAQCRNNIPYFILCLDPSIQILELMEKDRVDQAFRPWPRGDNRINKVEDEYLAKNYNLKKSDDRLSLNDALPFVRRIIADITEVDYVDRHVQTIIPIYDSLIYHWTNANKPFSVVQTCIEAASTALHVNNNEKAIFIAREAFETLESKVRFISPVQHCLMAARLLRLRGKAEFNDGNPVIAYELLLKAASMLGLKGLTSPYMYGGCITRFKDIFSYSSLMYRTKKHCHVDDIILEKGYVLADLFAMDRQQKHSTLKYSRAIQQFNIAESSLYLHQILQAYGSLIECCREKGMYHVLRSLELELLRGCAVRHQELYSEDRSILANIFKESTEFYFHLGDLERAAVAGRIVEEICMCGENFAICKTFTPYYFFICIMRKEFPLCFDLIMKMQMILELTNDASTATVIYHLLSVELALTGDLPFEPMPECLAVAANYMKIADGSSGEVTYRYYCAMTVALWYARKEQWDLVQNWFDFWETYQTTEKTFNAVLARCNKVECLLICLSRCRENGNHHRAREIKKQIKHDYGILKVAVREQPILQPRVRHLTAYFKVIEGQRMGARHSLYKARRMAERQGNLYELDWMEKNRRHWFDTPMNHLEEMNIDWEGLMQIHPLDCVYNTKERLDMFVLPARFIHENNCRFY